ncbi:methylenetetrahydrofolate reductase [NAD(P)H] [Pseudomonas sp. HK3]|jgi:methylenetetrahydrofolate reductase (NADPH)
MDNFRLSFEFFPTKTEEGTAKLYATRDKLAALNPDFFSVTYGAGGSTREHTVSTVIGMNEKGIGTAPHLSCVGETKANIKDLLNHYAQNDIERIVALRGDLPSGMAASAGELRYANELVELIRAEHGDKFHLEVAAYPEMHPQAKNFEQDLLNFKRKVDAGANSAITQYFFNVDSYFYFLDRCEQMGIDIPIVPGIMPITNYTKLARFSDSCGAEIPRWIRKQLEAYGDDSESIMKFGEEIITQMCEDLVENDVPGLHFYTLNQADPCMNVWKNLGLW